MAIYMEMAPAMGDVQGEATESDHGGWIELSSVNWNAIRNITTNVGSVETRELSQPMCSDVQFSKRTDKSSVALFKNALAGIAGKVVIEFTQTIGDGPRVYLQLTLENTLLSSYTVGGTGDWCEESGALNFTKIEFRYTPHDSAGVAGGPKTGHYDLQTGLTG